MVAVSEKLPQTLSEELPPELRAVTGSGLGDAMNELLLFRPNLTEQGLTAGALYICPTPFHTAWKRLLR